MKQCPVTYGRKRCEPFMFGMEGAKCTLEEGHGGDHVAKFVVEFGDSPESDLYGNFPFKEIQGG